MSIRSRALSVVQALVGAAGMIAGVVGVGTCASGFGQTASVHVGDWSMVAIRDTNTNTATGVLAVKDSTATTGGNLTVVAYRKSAAGGGGGGVWQASTWTGGLPSAIGWLAVNGEIADVAELDEIIPVGEPAPELAENPEPVVGGVIEGDPAEPLVTDPIDGPTFLSLLVSAGYPAADVPVGGGVGEVGEVDPCQPDAVLDAAMAGFAVPVTDFNATFQAAMTASCSSWCIYRWTSVINAWGSWSCGPWGLDPAYTSPVPSTSPCFDVCHYTRTITRTRKKYVITVHWDCSVTLSSYTQTETGEQKGRCNVDLSDFNCVHGARGCPGCDLSDILCSSGPNGTTTRTGWQ